MSEAKDYRLVLRIGEIADELESGGSLISTEEKVRILRIAAEVFEGYLLKSVKGE